jgi:hypothetical protein
MKKYVVIELDTEFLVAGGFSDEYVRGAIEDEVDHTHWAKSGGHVAIMDENQF